MCYDGTIFKISSIGDDGVLDDIDFIGLIGYWVLKLRNKATYISYDGGCGACADEYTNDRKENIIVCDNPFEYNQHFCDY